MSRNDNKSEQQKSLRNSNSMAKTKRQWKDAKNIYILNEVT